MSTYQVKEDGKNGTISIDEKGVLRTVKKFIGKDDTQFIPAQAIAFVNHNRKMIGADEVTVSTTAGLTFTWRVGKDVEMFVEQLNWLATQ